MAGPDSERRYRPQETELRREKKANGDEFVYRQWGNFVKKYKVIYNTDGTIIERYLPGESLSNAQDELKTKLKPLDEKTSEFFVGKRK